MHLVLDHVPIEAIRSSDQDLHDLLCWALILNDEDLARKLLAFSPDVDRAAKNEDDEPSATVSAIIWDCSDSLFKDILSKPRASTNQSMAARLYETAVEQNQIKFAEMLHESEISVNSSNSRGETPLVMAAKHNQADMAQWLLEHGADVKSADDEGWNAAHHSCASGSSEILRILKATNIDWHIRVHWRIEDIVLDEVTTLHIAAWFGEMIILEYIIDNGLSDNLNCVTACGVTPLYMAVWQGHTETVSWLLSKDVITGTMAFGESPLHLCVRFGNGEMYALFESQKCDFTATTKAGLDCEMIAWKHDHKELAERIGRAKGK